MRKIAAGALAIPVLLLVYFERPVRRSIAARVGVVLALVGLAGVAGLTVLGPAPTVATPPSTPTVLPSAAFHGLRVGLGVYEPVAIRFTAPMDRASVEAAVSIEPNVAVRLHWQADSTAVTLAPEARWSPGTYYTVTVAGSALDAHQQQLDTPARAAFTTRAVATGRIAASVMSGKRAPVNSGIVMKFDRPVLVADVEAALRIAPAVPGALVAPAESPVASTFTFKPAAPLAADTVYRVALAGTIRDADGAPVEAPAAFAVRTVKAPAVVRFRPLDGAKQIEYGANLSVRFTQPMNRSATEKAFSATRAGKAIAGALRWAEGDTVLILDPSSALPAGATIQLNVAKSARSASGAPIDAAIGATFKTIPKPAPRPVVPAPVASRTTVPVSRPVPRPSTSPSTGTAVGAGTWAAVETYYLRLMNCTRTGGNVTSTGTCSSPGGRDVAPLALDAGISSSVARPYAKMLATTNQCNHFIGGNPGDRLRRAGYSSYRWAENLGCRSGDASAAVLGSHLYFQSERSYNGGHFRNMMNAAFDRVGIGVWASGGRVRLVVDFYHP